MDVENRNSKAYAKGLTFRDMVNQYNDYAMAKYEEDLSPERYRGPEYAAEALASYVPVEERSNYSVLDVGAGTGFVGLQLHFRGFSQIEALEPSDGMVRLAMRKGIYTAHHPYCMGKDPTPLHDDTYDAITVAGAMGENHIPCVALQEFIRLVKPGGLVVITMRERYLETVKEYANRLEPYMEKLEREGAWEQLVRDSQPQYAFDYLGALFVYRVLTSGTIHTDV